MVMMLNVAFFYPVDLGLVSLEELEPVSWLAFKVVPKVMFGFTTIVIFVVGFPILRGAWIGIRTGILNMDNLLSHQKLLLPRCLTQENLEAHFVLVFSYQLTSLLVQIFVEQSPSCS